MKPQVPAPALRAARALLRLSQLELSERADVNVKSLRAAERGNGTEASNQRLRAFFESEKIEFLGSIDVGTGDVVGAGARWRDPRSSLQSINEEHISVPGEFALSAARAFLSLNLTTVSAATSIDVRVISEIEDSLGGRNEVRRQLVEFYRDRGITFLGWRDQSSDRYYGVGVAATE
jgi:transcriptional regulator with XRE-family HTH domain